MENYKIECRPQCLSENVVQGNGYRISILTASLIRLEYDKSNRFENRATQTVLNRDFPKVNYEAQDHADELTVYTAYLELHYDKKPFSSNGLTVTVRGQGVGTTWHYGQEPNDLKGTARTLDQADGAVPLERGLLSRKGYSILDDSGTMALTEDGWIEPRNSNAVDLYFFGYGHRYLECLKDYFFLCGKAPLLPRYAFGNWWSRYHQYTQDEYQDLMRRFREEKLPFTVAVIDMDWHLVEEVDAKYGTGWTGYTWNQKLFPDHVGFLKWLHEQGMKVSLNIHPADGIRAYEAAYPGIAEAMGMNPEEEKPVLFDPADPEFLKVYFEKLLHPMEEEGVDFWWIDWQQGTHTKIPGLDPLWVLNHYHYLDSSWKGSRPITFSRYAGPGSHRYPVGFSGDTVITWDSLDFQPYFTATASNIGYGWWSHDIGGHMNGIRDDELMARWVQYGAFSPINRLHSSNNPFSGKEPWKYNRITKEVMERYLRLRHRMIPYLYTMNRRSNRDSLPLIQPMYYQEPETSDAYRVPNEYYFGSELIVSPITKPADRASRMSKAKTWLPRGMWVDMFRGTVYTGDRMINMWREMENLPVLIKAGGILPLSNEEQGDNSVGNPSSLEVRVFPASDGAFVLWEDQGDSCVDREENWASTRFALSSGRDATFVIEAAEGNLSAIPQRRSWKLVFYGTKKDDFAVTVDGREVPYESWNEESTQSLVVELKDIDVEKTVQITIKGYSLPEEKIEEKCFEILNRAQIGYPLKARAYREVEGHGKQAIPGLMALELGESVLGAITEILTAR